MLPPGGRQAILRYNHAPMGVVLPQPIRFGKYTLFERIGRGGMADVFKARIQGPAGFERVFVVKRILPHLSDDPQFTRMFIEEAKMSARLSHPNIVQVFELGAVGGEYFIAMEYVRGRDLSEAARVLWAKMGPPQPDFSAYVGREMCRALNYAHELTADDGATLGMIHRDVSPSNVMLSFDGLVKLLDFGIAKALGGEQQDEGATQRGMLKGKFAYMAPEQTQGSDVDRRIDIFAAGIVLHELLTGRRLFKGENDLQTVEKVRQCDVPPPSLQNPLCPQELDAIVLRALAPDRNDRFQSASEMADALDDIVHATRFQPTHMSQVMRELFPTEMGEPRPGTGSMRVQATQTGTASRPNTQQQRSPTIPPVSRSVSVIKLTPAHAELAGRRAKAFYRRNPVWATAALLAVAFAGGAIWTRSSVRVVPHGAGVGEGARTMKLPLMLDSDPPGADVYVVGTGEQLGRTPFKKEFEWNEDQRTILGFRLGGFEETTHEVRPTWNGYVRLKRAAGRPTVKPLDPPPQAQPPPQPEAPVIPPPPVVTTTPAPQPAPAPPSTRRNPGKKPRKTNDLVNPF